MIRGSFNTDTGCHCWLAQRCAVALLGIAVLVATGCESASPPASASPPPEPTKSEKSAPAFADPSTAASSPEAAIADEQPAAPAAEPAVAATPAATQNITFDTLKFPLEKNADYQRSLLTPAIEAIDGRPVRLRGYILPSFQQSGITQFVLVRDNMQCCFGPGAALYDCVVVDMKPGKSTEFTVRPVAVEGTFALRDFLGPDGKHLAIYHLDGDAVRP